MLYKQLTGEIIEAFYKVYNKLGYGFLEKVYENALLEEFRMRDLKTSQQYPISVYYNRKMVGEYYADIIVDEKIILELKASEKLCKSHEFQLINYLRATDIQVGLLLNFGRTPQFSRKIYTKKPKQ